MFSDKKHKIFCISFQRTGTTSVGQFFKDHGFEVAGYHKTRSTTWSTLRFLGKYEDIFKSKDFKKHQVFEDNPWFEEDFYKILFHKFPRAKFILFTRDSDKWFDSMVNHSNGKTLGNTFRHSRIYSRLEEFFDKYPEENHYTDLGTIDNLLDLNESHREHYKSVYRTRNKEVIDFFKAFSPDSLFVCELEDEKKWIKLGAFFGIKVSENYESHLNKTN